MEPIFWLIDEVLNLYQWALVIWVVMSWLLAFNVINAHNRLVYAVNDFLYRITEPALRPIRRFVPLVGGIDLSPIVLILLVVVIRMYLAKLEFKLVMG